jgi:hypothetical protein
VSDLLHNIHPFVDFNFTIIIIGSLNLERERERCVKFAMWPGLVMMNE